MKKRILCFALAAMLIGGNAATAIPVYAAESGTSITLTKSEDDPYTGREYVAASDKTTVAGITLPDGWEWEDATQTLSTGFADAVAIRKKDGAEINRVTVKVKKEAGTVAPTTSGGSNAQISGTGDSGSSGTSKKAGSVAPGSSKIAYTAPTSINGTDARITGVDSTMEYSTDGGKTWTAVTGTEITGLSAGEVWIRVKETSDTAAGEKLKINIPAYQTPDTVVTAPKTGDENHLELWVSLFVCSVIALGIVLVIGRRKEQDAE